MRKWMSDRLKRRKKGGEGAAKEKANAPEPLQPKYFESDLGEKPVPAAESASAPEPEPETQADFQLTERRSSKSDSQPESEPAAAPPSGEARPRPARRRRKRGGRGGSRRSPAEAAPSRATSARAAAQAPPLTPESASAEPPPAPVAPVPAHPPSHAAPSAPARPSKGTVVLAIGLPGSGKSSWFKRHDIHPLSSDLLRELLFDDAQEQRFQDLVFSNLRSMLKARLIARRPMNYVDATNLTPHDRHSWIKLAKDYGYDVQGLFFDVPLEVCLERHRRRGRVVPEDIMRKMASKLKPPTFEEGFSKITVVRVKQKGSDT
jgi:predicted kinase